MIGRAGLAAIGLLAVLTALLMSKLIRRSKPTIEIEKRASRRDASSPEPRQKLGWVIVAGVAGMLLIQSRPVVEQTRTCRPFRIPAGISDSVGVAHGNAVIHVTDIASVVKSYCWNSPARLHGADPRTLVEHFLAGFR